MISQCFIGSLPFSLPDEFPRQRNLSGKVSWRTFDMWNYVIVAGLAVPAFLSVHVR